MAGASFHYGIRIALFAFVIGWECGDRCQVIASITEGFLYFYIEHVYYKCQQSYDEGCSMALDPLGKAGPSQNALPASPPKTGFMSQPSEHQELPFDLHDLLVKHNQAVFFFRASGEPFDKIAVYDDDIVIVDRVIGVEDGRLVVAVDNEEFIIRWIERRVNGWFLVTDNESDAPIPVYDGSAVFGVVTHVIHEIKRRKRSG